MSTAYEIWDGDLYLYTVETEWEADMADEAGFRVVAFMQHEEDFDPFNTVNS